jgi:predicted RNA binding protein YcfA (HicA-like mRNA interferase family)
MKSMTGKELAKILEKHEWILITIQGIESKEVIIFMEN